MYLLCCNAWSYACLQGTIVFTHGIVDGLLILAFFVVCSTSHKCSLGLGAEATQHSLLPGEPSSLLQVPGRVTGRPLA